MPGIGAHNFAKSIEKLRRAVSGQAHHFVFISEFPETEILRQRGVIHPQRMRKRGRPVGRKSCARAIRPHRTREIAKPIHRKDRGAIERRNKIGAGEMRHVMLDAMKCPVNRSAGSISNAVASSSLIPENRAITRARSNCESRHAQRISQFGPQRAQGFRGIAMWSTCARVAPASDRQ